MLNRRLALRGGFGGGVVQDRDGLELKIRKQLHVNQGVLGVQCSQLTVDGCFAELIRAAHAESGRRSSS